jgi:hypothetical protein
MSFGMIYGPEDPEEFSWVVQLGEGQELKEIDDQEAAVYYEDSTRAFSMGAEPAHDADGATVPTTLAVSEGNVITLTVHHRVGDPAGGAAFDYPVTPGDGWVGGFQSYVIFLGEPQPPTPAPPQPTAICSVPSLAGKSLLASRRKLKRAGCVLGKVRGKDGRAAKVVKQDLRPGMSTPAGSAVGVKLG